MGFVSTRCLAEDMGTWKDTDLKYSVVPATNLQDYGID